MSSPTPPITELPPAPPSTPPSSPPTPPSTNGTSADPTPITTTTTDPTTNTTAPVTTPIPGTNSTSSNSTITTPPTSSPPSTPITSTSRRSSNQDIITQTSTLFVSQSRNVASASSSADSGSSGTPFLKNTPAVAGVFTVIGLIGLGVIFLLARNFYRRRQQEAFDRELQEATREAAATSTAPFFDDDDDDPYKRTGGSYGPPSGYGSTSERQFSDMSHGTYGQPAMSVDSYGMREIGHNVGPGEIYASATADPYTAGAAGIGVVRARSMRADVHSVGGPNGLHQQYVRQPDYGAALADGNKPYAAFAAPKSGNMTGGTGDPYPTSSKGLELLDAAGLGVAGVATAAAAAARPQSQAPPYGQQQQHVGYHQSRNPNQFYATGVAPSAYAPAHENRYSTVNEDMEDAYGGVADGGGADVSMGSGGHGAEPSLPNPFERELGSSDGHGRGRMDGKENEDAESVHSQDDEPRRVLKVANQ